LLKEFVLEGIFSAFIVRGLPMHLVVAGLQLLLVGGGFYILLRTRNLNLLLLSIVSVSLLLLFEVSARFYLFGWDSLDIEKMNSVRYFAIAGLLEPSPHPKFDYQMKPNMRTYFKMAEFITNSDGLRDKEYTVEKPRSTFRVAVVGDSYTLPSGVKIEEAYHTLLEKRLNAERESTSFQFINFGGAGGSLRAYLLVIEYITLKYNPDLILLGFCAENDHEVSRPISVNKDWKPKKMVYPFFFNLYSLELIKSMSRIAVKSFSSFWTKESYAQKEVEYMKEMFARMQALSKEVNVPIVIAFLANRQIGTEKIGLVGKLAEENGLLFVDVSSSFAGTKVKDYSIHHPIDSHPNGKANRIFADQIHSFLIGEELVPER
jgi:hypothetical protein